MRKAGNRRWPLCQKRVWISGRGKGERRDLGKWKGEEEMRAHKLGEIREGGKGEAKRDSEGRKETGKVFGLEGRFQDNIASLFSSLFFPQNGDGTNCAMLSLFSQKSARKSKHVWFLKSLFLCNSGCLLPRSEGLFHFHFLFRGGTGK